MRVAITGAAGRLGAVLKAELSTPAYNVTGLTQADMNLTNPLEVERTIAELKPHVVINCSAYNAVDAAEADRDSAFAVNAEGPRLLARATRAAGALLVHFSTDFVFDGDATTPYTEDAPTNPRSTYGASKLAGETAVRNVSAHYILRVESLFGGSGVNGHVCTIDQIKTRMLADQVVSVVADRTVSPSYVPDVARATRALIEQSGPYGTYHCVNSGFGTWLDLASEIARHLGIQPRLVSVAAADLKLKAHRPRFCALSNNKLTAAGIVMPTWQSAIGRHLQQIPQLS
jgi:dTDP-4-dehydrorhamnose reductase